MHDFVSWSFGDTIFDIWPYVFFVYIYICHWPSTSITAEGCHVVCINPPIVIQVNFVWQKLSVLLLQIFRTQTFVCLLSSCSSRSTVPVYCFQYLAYVSHDSWVVLICVFQMKNLFRGRPSSQFRFYCTSQRIILCFPAFFLRLYLELIVMCVQQIMTELFLIYLICCHLLSSDAGKNLFQ